MKHSPEVICPSCYRKSVIRPPVAPCAMKCIWCKQPFLISASDIEALRRNEIVMVSPHPDAIVGTFQLKLLCSGLTGQTHISSVEYIDAGVQEMPSDPALKLGKHKMLTTRLKLDYSGRKLSDNELISLYFFDYYETGSKSAMLVYTNIFGNQIMIAMTSNMHDWAENRNEIYSANVEASVKVARWIVADGMQFGIPGANAIITRTDMTPNPSTS